MQELSLEKQKLLMLEILLDFDKVCRNNGIRYSLVYGTLLGAVRHQGFIPWDDDIDVIVFRADYEKLIQILNSQMQGNHSFICVENNPGFSAPLGKIIDNTTILEQSGHFSDRINLGVYIDVFPYDMVPEKKSDRKKVLKKAVFLQTLWSFCGNNNNKRNKAIVIIRKLINKTPLARWIALYMNRWASKNNFDKNTMANLIFGYEDREKEIMRVSDLLELTEYSFEGHSFLGIQKSDFYLKQWYGNYTQLPPIEERVSHHAIKVYSKVEQ